VRRRAASSLPNPFMTRAARGSYSASMDVVTVDLTGGRVAEEAQMRVFLNFGEHGRELITSQVAFRLLQLLSLGPAATAVAALRGSAPSGGGAAALAAALERTVFKVVPLENAGGRAKVESGELCLRKNGRGVDPNRNWGMHWGFKEKDFDPYEEAPGAHPFSEPEAVLLRDALAAWRPLAWVNVHSGMRALFMPYDHVAAMPQGPGGDAMRAVLASLRASHCPECVTGSGGASVGYLAHGTATDYIFVNMSVPVVMTWEIFGDEKAAFDDCFRMFNPLTREEHDTVADTWAAACAALPGALAEHVAPRPRGWAAGAARTGATAVRRAGGDALPGAAPLPRPWIAYGGAALLVVGALTMAAGGARRRAGARAAARDAAGAFAGKQSV